MSRALTFTRMKNIAFCVILLCILQKTVSTSAANTNGCPNNIHTCQCLHGGSNDMIDIDATNEDPRLVGLAAATGALGGVLVTGAAFAAYIHFRSNGGGGGGGRNPGGGQSPHGGEWKTPRSPRPESKASSSDSFDSQSPLTKDRRGEKLALESRSRPYTGASATSSVTNIYRHAKVWPGRF